MAFPIASINYMDYIAYTYYVRVYGMSMEEQLEQFIATNKDSIKMGVVAGQLEEAIKVIFNAGYEAGKHEVLFHVELLEQNLGD